MNTIDDRFKLIKAIAKTNLSTREAIAIIIAHCVKQFTDEDWSAFSELPFEKDIVLLRDWLVGIFDKEPCDEYIKALYFGITENGTLYLAGSDECDLKDKSFDWLCDPTYLPVEGTAPSLIFDKLQSLIDKLENNQARSYAGYVFPFGYAALAVRDLCHMIPHSQWLGTRNNRVIAVGFDEGDVIVVANLKLKRQRFSPTPSPTMATELSAHNRNECLKYQLHNAVLNHDIAEVKRLLAIGADVNEKFVNKSNQLHYGYTPLHLTAETGQIEIAKVLIENGANITELAKYGNTPLHIAVINSQKEFVEFLLDYGTPIDQTKGTQTPLQLASSRGNASIVKLLLSRGANPNYTPDRDKLSSLNMAAYKGYTDIMRILLDYGADVSLRDRDGWTPLISAVRETKYCAAKLLVEAGSDVNAITKSKESVLEIAILYSYKQDALKIVDLLLSHGADQHQQFKDGRIPIQYALMHNMIELEKILKKYM